MRNDTGSIEPPIDSSLAGYLRECGRGPFAVIAWTKYAALIAVGVFGAVTLFGADDTRSQIIGATLMIVGLLGGAVVWLGFWLLKLYDAQQRGLRELARRVGRDA